MNILSRHFFCAIVFCITLSTTILVAQTPYQPSGLVKKTGPRSQVDLASVIIKDNDGKTLDAQTFIQLLQTGEYDSEAYVDEQEQVKEIVIRPRKEGSPRIELQQVSSNSLKDELENVRIKDQALRKLLMSITTSINDTNSEEYKYLMLLMVQEDVKNQEQVIKIVDENGWLGISQVGVLANSALFLVIQHASLELQEKYFPLLKESAEKGESNLADMALMDDRIRMRRKLKQLYGSQTVNINGKNYVWPIEDPQNVDERRKQVQLPPLSDYLKIVGLSYPQDELPSELF